MDTLDIIIATIGAAGFVGLAWLSGYRLGAASERDLADRRINGVLASINAAKPRLQRRRAKK